MSTRPKALPRVAASLVTTHPLAPHAAETRPVESTVAPLDFDGTASLSHSALRAQAREAAAPGARLAACWRLMIRGQALPQTAPTEGIRLLTLINLATQQDLDLLEILLCFDPSSSVRAQAATLLWRATRDRDRVVDLLASRLQKEPSSEVITHLLALEPALPVEKIRDVVQSYLHHPAIEIRRASWSFWTHHGEPIDGRVSDVIWSEPSPELRASLLQRWAEGPAHSSLLPQVREHPDAAADALEALFQAKRSFTIAELVPLLDEHPVESVLQLARGPFDAEARRVLISLTGLLSSDGADEVWIGPELWRCLRSAYVGGGALVLTDEEKAWAAILEEMISAYGADPACEDNEEYVDWEDGLSYAMSLLGLLRRAQA